MYRSASILLFTGSLHEAQPDITRIDALCQELFAGPACDKSRYVPRINCASFFEQFVGPQGCYARHMRSRHAGSRP